MTLLGRSLVLVALAVVVAGCGGQGSATSNPGVAAKPCPVYPVQHALQSCHSRASDWVLSLRYDPHHSRCKLLFGRTAGAAPAWTYRGDCGLTTMTWVKPHQLLLQTEYPIVSSLDPSARTTTTVAQLSDFRVSPNGEWIAGTGPGDPKVDPVANTVYVVSVRGRKCLVVPGRSSDISGFTPDSQNVIVRRSYANGTYPLGEFALSSLPSNCPTGANGILPRKS
ncbi:MAG: hypothetical protein ACRDL7_13610 [Gaiellaceae bacterium]